MGRRHKPTPALLFSLVAALVLLAALSLRVRAHTVSWWERDLFHAINQLPHAAAPVLVTVMQLGSYPAVFAAVLAALTLRQFWPALEFLIAGNLAYWLAVLAKALVARERPGQLLAEVRLRETITGSLGYPSGHMAVATALGIILAHHLPQRYRRYIWAMITLVGIARVYVGAHLPFDVAGGLLVGWLAVSLTRIIVGSPGPAQTLARTRDALNRHGYIIRRLTPVVSDARGSIPFKATTSNGEQLFVKVTSGEQRDADWLYKLYRRVRYRNIEDEPPFVTAKQKNEHEAYLSLLAEEAGVRIPHLITTATGAEGEGLLVQEFVNGRTLDELDAAELDDATLAGIWHQVALLHRAGIAHRDLRGANVIVQDSSAYLIDLSFAEENASAVQRARDIVELLVASACLASAPRAVAAAITALGPDAVAASAPYLQKPLFSRATRALLNEQPDLLDNVRREIVDQLPGTSAEPARVVRVTRRNLLLLLMLGLLVHFLLPQLGEVRLALRQLFHANLIAVLGSLLASAATYLLSGLTLRIAAGKTVALGPTIAAQVAASFANALTPASVGGLAVGVRYLRKQGLSVPVAATAVATTRVAGVISVILLLPVLLPFARGPGRNLLAAAKSLTVLLVVLGALLLLAVALAVPKLRARSRTVLRQVIDSVRSIIRSRSRLQLVSAGLGQTLALGACLYLALLSVGLPLEFSLLPKVVLVSILGEGLASAVPTPGGLGATEAALVSGLVFYGIPIETAIAGVLIYRLASFWLTIPPGFIALRVLTWQDRL
ncbi:MAG TPA: flippase-like domain-containing protein [Micromonosporaceae bacterium]|nr:flippase-like domain-containing protein [Micromonosporaceae bacterium]